MNDVQPLGRQTADMYAAWFKALADGTRVQIVSLLARAGRPLTVKEIVAAVPVGQSTVSEHLRQPAAVPFVLAEGRGTSPPDPINDARVTCFPTAADPVMGKPSARGVGRAGKAYGLDMTEEMLDLARASARAAGAGNVEFLRGQIEAIPLPGGSVDVIISNCVINLSTARPAVFAESFRVLRPGGRLGISDILAEDRLTPAERLERGTQAGCIAGAPSFAEYRGGPGPARVTGLTIPP